MSDFILVHGAWHNASCWYKLTPLLTGMGHQVQSPNLPGHTEDGINPAKVTLQDYVKVIKDQVLQQPAPVILVGHSMAGIIISEVAEALPDRISKLVYLSAFLLQDGESMLEVVQQDTGTLVMPNLVYSRDRRTATLRQAVVRDAFFHDCSPEDAAIAEGQLVPQALAPIATPVHVSEREWGRIPRAYIMSNRDRAVSPFIQQQMIERSPCQSVYQLPSGHSSFLSFSNELAACLHELAAG